MKTKAAALQSWLEQFGMPAYAAQAVPETAELPYLTYTLTGGAWGDGEQALVVNTWRRTASEAKANADADAISKALGLGGCMVACEGGGFWLKRGEPFAQAADSDAQGVKRRYINLTIEYFTTF
jgi:hypothetical protein